MCGFVAIASNKVVAPERIELGLRAIGHRGPDGSGIWRSPDGLTALGHTRLAIIDLSTGGAQPMRSADGRGMLAYNGELYNFRELARTLPGALRSQSDTEVLLELLRQRGVDALSSLRGMFAFSYWDGEELLLVRDRLGIKPLFYAEADGFLAAASEIPPVLAMRGTPAAVDGRAIDDYLTYLYVPPPRTGIRGVFELPPGHILRWTQKRGGVVERYWTVPSHSPRANGRPRRIRELLEDSVRAHLVADAPVGVFLSGGLDSSSIVALAAKHYPSTLKTFSVTFGDEGRYLDERSFAREVANRFGTQHREIHVQADVAGVLPELVARFGQPFGNPTAVLTYELSRATREHVKVALAGDGGDEVLGGYPRYQGIWSAELLRKMPSGSQRALLGLAKAMVPARTARGKPADRLERFLAHAQEPLDDAYFRWLSYLDSSRKAALFADRSGLLGQDAPREPYEFLADARRLHPDLETRDAAPLIDLHSFLPCNVLAYGDRMSMAHALEVRVPFCDHLLVESLAGLPLHLKMPLGVQKGLLRVAMHGILPTRILTHRKVGFNPPISAWLQGPLRPMVEEYLGERSVRARGLLSPTVVADLRSQFAAGRGEFGHLIWALLILEAWLRWLP